MVILEAREVWKSLGGRLVLHGASLRVAKGERVVVLGANGSGKSTLLSIMAGVLDADAGEVVAAGAIGFAPEKPDLPDHLLVVEWLDVVASLKGERNATPLDTFGLGPFMRKKLSALSLGQRQRVSLASAWTGRPDVLVLDEPTNGLDADVRAAVLDQLREGTSIVATHDPELASSSFATRVVVVTGGRVEGGRP